MRQSISVIVLTYNEEINLEQCLKSVLFADEVIIIDCGSDDNTLKIAERYHARIYTHPFTNQAQQFNWALDNLLIKSEWILKLDSDEYLTPELQKEIQSLLTSLPTNVNGFYIKRRVYFMGKWIKHGGYYPVWFLRLWRKGKARSEEKKMDEHIVLLEGKADYLKNDFVDDDKKGLHAWIEKHKKYVVREAEEILARGSTSQILASKNREEVKPRNIASAQLFDEQSRSRRNFYYKLPPFFRVFVYFIYRYFFRLGFLDGWQGTIFHFLHGFWYRLLVDAKIYESRIKKFH